MSMLDEVDHRRAHRGDRGGERQVVHDPLRGRGAHGSTSVMSSRSIRRRQAPPYPTGRPGFMQ
jgi:hypothetical protein